MLHSKKTAEEIEADIERELSSPWWMKKRFVTTAAALLVVAVSFFAVWLYTGAPWEVAKFAPGKQPPDNVVLENLSIAYDKVEVFRVEGHSMEPYFKDGQKVFVATKYYESNEPERDDVATIALSTEPKQYIKRVAFVAGDKFYQAGNVFYLNDSSAEMMQRKIVLDADSPLYQQLVGYGYTVPKGTVIALGDNPAGSVDSRAFGLIIEEELSGKVIR
jgi:signal peptidase I